MAVMMIGVAVGSRLSQNKQTTSAKASGTEYYTYCNDNDRGDNPGQPGSIYAITNKSNYVSEKDTCGNGYITEWYCDGADNPHSIAHVCNQCTQGGGGDYCETIGNVYKSPTPVPPSATPQPSATTAPQAPQSTVTPSPTEPAHATPATPTPSPTTPVAGGTVASITPSPTVTRTPSGTPVPTATLMLSPTLVPTLSLRLDPTTYQVQLPTPTLAADCRIVGQAVNIAMGTTCSSSFYSPLSDVNNDGNVDSIDLSLYITNMYNPQWCAAQRSDYTNPCACAILGRAIAAANGNSCTGAYIPSTDVNNDGKTDGADFVMFNQNSSNRAWCEEQLNDTYRPVCFALTPSPALRADPTIYRVEIPTPTPTRSVCSILPDLRPLDFVEDNILNIQDFYVALNRAWAGDKSITALLMSRLIANIGTNMAVVESSCVTPTIHLP